jgi:hypothetical protein
MVAGCFGRPGKMKVAGTNFPDEAGVFHLQKL